MEKTTSIDATLAQPQESKEQMAKFLLPTNASLNAGTDETQALSHQLILAEPPREASESGELPPAQLEKETPHASAGWHTAAKVTVGALAVLGISWLFSRISAPTPLATLSYDEKNELSTLLIKPFTEGVMAHCARDDLTGKTVCIKDSLAPDWLQQISAGAHRAIFEEYGTGVDIIIPIYVESDDCTRYAGGKKDRAHRELFSETHQRGFAFHRNYEQVTGTMPGDLPENFKHYLARNQVNGFNPMPHEIFFKSHVFCHPKVDSPLQCPTDYETYIAQTLKV